MSVYFEWDQSKNERNRKKHGVSFEEARTVFLDPLAGIFDDETHSANERREIIFGNSILNRLIVVCYTERADCIRIISARPATPRERKTYEEDSTI